MKTLHRKPARGVNRTIMSESTDIQRVARLLTQQQATSELLARTVDSEECIRLEDEIRKIRHECLELVDPYCRLALRPVLAKRFPGKGVQSAPKGQEVYSNDAVVRYTELINDFFVQVLAMSDDEFWKKKSAIELRNYASTVISNNIRDLIRHRRKQASLDDNQVRSTFEDQLAVEVNQRFVADRLMLDLEAVLETLDQWELSRDPYLQKLASLIRHKYVSGMTIPQIAADLDVSPATAYRLLHEAFLKLREFISR